MRYGVIDLANLFFRVQHSTQGDAFTRSGMALHILFRTLRQLHREMKIDHMVFCTEGKSWRYSVYPAYKARRKLERLNKTEKEKEEDEVLMGVLYDLIDYLKVKTRCTVLQKDGVEGDDFVARWIQLHSNDEHIVLSGDSDFVQLLAPNVTIVDGARCHIIDLNGVRVLGTNEPCAFHVNPKNGKIKVDGLVKDLEKKHLAEQKKLAKEHEARVKQLKADFEKEERIRAQGANYIPSKFVAPKPFVAQPYTFTPEEEWWKKALFLKIVRGDTGDGIFPAYPGVRYEGSKNRVGIREAWEDRNTGGYNWNNFMLTKFEKVVGKDGNNNPIIREVRVLDEFRVNEEIIDLTKQPKHVIEMANDAIVEAVQKELVGNVGIHFMKFCGKNELNNLSKEAHDHVAYLGAGYAR